MNDRVGVWGYGSVGGRQSVHTSPHPNVHSRRSAFTLVELIVVMFVLVVMMAVAAPSFSRMHQSSSLRACARTMVATFRYARGLAVTRQTEVRLIFSDDSRSYQIMTRRPTETEEMFVPERTEIGRQHKLPVGINAAMTKGASMEDEKLLAFHPNGSTDEAVLTLTNRSGQTMYVTLFPATGRAAVETNPDKISQLFTMEGR